MRNPLGLVYRWFCRAIESSVYIRACTILAFQSEKEEELPRANFKLKKWCVKLVVTKGENLQWSFANEHWTEAEPKSDSQVGCLMNVAEFRATFVDKLYYYQS